MIYIRIELWPFGNQQEARVLSEVVIANVGGDTRQGEYEVRASQEGGFLAEGFKLNSMTQSGKHRERLRQPKEESVLVKVGARHKRSLGFWPLLRKVFGKIDRELRRPT
jgi:hypothetical protein